MILHSEWTEPGRIIRCARHDCRTTVTEDTAVQCPHGETFCQGCTFEEACLACAAEALFGPPTHERAPHVDDSAAELVREDRETALGQKVERYVSRRDNA